MARGLGLSTVLGCLSKGERVMGISPENWMEPSRGGNPDMRAFLERQLDWRQGLRMVGEDQRSFATTDHSEFVKVMKEWRMNLSTPPYYPINAVYMGSQLKELMTWTEVGKRVDGSQGPEFILKGVKYHQSDHSAEPVLEIETMRGDSVFMVRRAPSAADFEMLEWIELMERSFKPYPFRYSGAQIRFVSTEIRPDLSWMLNMANGRWYIAFVEQYLRVGMDQTGVAVREETQIVSRSLSIHADEPVVYRLSPNRETFWFWRRRKGVKFPMSMFQFDKEDFVDPGNLDEIVS